MAKLRLHRDETRDLPAVCMKCGVRSDTTVTRTFSWVPGWVLVLIIGGLLPYLIVSLMLTRRMTVAVPLCARHKNHWLMRTMVTLFGFLGVLAIGVLAVVAGTALNERGGDPDPLFGLACATTVVGLIAWLVVASILQNSAIRAKEITEYDIDLIRVDPEFVRAVEDRRDQEYDDDDDLDDDARPARRDRPDDLDDPDRYRIRR